MNVKLLKQVRDYIAKYPEKYDQSRWCGSACCVAGTTAFLGGKVTRKALSTVAADSPAWQSAVAGVDVEQEAMELLGLDEYQADNLFDQDWRYVARGQFDLQDVSDPKQRSAIAVKRINHFIRTKGAE